MARGRKKETPTPEERLQAALVPESEQPYRVPGNWCWIRQNAICSLSDGEKRTGENLPYWEVKALRGLKEIQYVTEGKFLPKGTKVILVDGENSGEVFDIPTDGFMGSTFKSLSISSSINWDYLRLFITTKKELYRNNKKGSAIPHLNKDLFFNMPLPFAPLAEQQRIVDRIESLFAKLDEAKQKARDALDSFETRKAAILHKAFTGELTAQWRKDHGVGMESWEKVQWGNFIISIEAGKNWSAEGRPPQNNEFGVVKVSAVTWGEFNEIESKTCTVEDQWNENVQIHERDFLFSRANTLQLVGNCVIVKSISRRLMLSDKILRFKFNKSVIPDYILNFTRSNLYRNQIEQLASGNQDGMRNVSQKNMKLVEFPIPKIEEQAEIVRILDDLLAKEQQAREAAEGVLEQIDLIKKAILARAFRGELGTNDPGEESAVEFIKSVLEVEPNPFQFQEKLKKS